MDAEFKTQAGLRLVVKDWVCSVHKVGSAPRDYPVPEVIFAGQVLRPQTEGQALFSVKKGRQLIPYAGLGTNARIGLPCSAEVDQFPAVIRRAGQLKELMLLPAGSGLRFIVVDEAVPRIELITLKVKQPQAQVLVVHAAEQEGPPPDTSRIRARDLLSTDHGEELQKNPVFMARVHLRNLELPRVRDLLVEFEMSDEEIQFVRTFLQLMIRNERNQADLQAAQGELVHLDELYRVAGVLASGQRELFDRELERVGAALARDLLPLVSRRRARAPGREDQIYYWECEFRLTQTAEKTA